MLANETLSVSDVFALADVLNAVTGNANVRYLDENGNVVSGVTRRLAGENGSSRLDDVRAAYVEITDGFATRHESLTRLATLAKNGGFAVDAR
jgi:hypothetical protein